MFLKSAKKFKKDSSHINTDLCFEKIAIIWPNGVLAFLIHEKISVSESHTQI